MKIDVNWSSDDTRVVERFYYTVPAEVDISAVARAYAGRAKHTVSVRGGLKALRARRKRHRQAVKRNRPQ